MWCRAFIPDLQVREIERWNDDNQLDKVTASLV